MADGDRQLAFTTGDLPVSVQVSGADKLTPKAVNASFDGTGAGGDFLPCLIIIGRTGHEVARIPAPQVAAGASAEVSWFPRVGGKSGGGSGIQFDTDNEGGWLFVDTHAAISGISPDYDGKGLALVDGNDDGIVIDSDQGVFVNTVQNGDLVVGQPGNGQNITLNGDVALDGTFDAGGAQLRNGADGTAPDDFATVGQLGGSGVSDLDGITGSVTLVAGANITITDNDPAPGDIRITAAGGTGGGAQLDYAQITAPVTITGTTDATATTVITGNAVTYDGLTRIKLEYFLGALLGTGSEILFVIYDGSTDLGRCSFASNQGGSAIDAWVPGAMFLTPSAGTHTFSIRAWKIGTASVYAGAGGAGATLPAWYRITEA